MKIYMPSPAYDMHYH